MLPSRLSNALAPLTLCLLLVTAPAWGEVTRWTSDALPLGAGLKLQPSSSGEEDIELVAAQEGESEADPELEAERHAEAEAEGAGELAGELDPKEHLAAPLDLERLRGQFDIPIDLEPEVEDYIRFFQTRGRAHFVKWLGRSSRYLPMMQAALEEAGLPRDMVYLSMIESGFSPQAYSRARAAGLWQFIEATGKRYGLRVDFWVDERRDPERSTRAAIAFLGALYAEFGDWRLAWAAYNAGPGRIRRALANDGVESFWQIARGGYLRRETQHYVPKLMAAAIVSKNLEEFGISPAEIAAAEALEYEEVEAHEAIELETVARAAGVPVERVRELNPALKRWCLPPAARANALYGIKIPKGSAERFAQSYPKLASSNRLTFKLHRVAKGDTLSQIGKRYGSAVEAIMRMNELRDSRRLRLGAELVVPVPRGGGAERLALAAQRQGFRAAPTSEEIPASPRVAGQLAGTTKRVNEGGRVKVIYAVAAGDSLWTIAQRFGVTVDQLVGWNALRSRRAVLSIGRELSLYPAGEAGGS